jgi:hypothetical protein
MRGLVWPRQGSPMASTAKLRVCGFILPSFFLAGPALGGLAVWWTLARSHASHASGESVLLTLLGGDT